MEFPSLPRFISTDRTSCCLLLKTSDLNEVDERNYCSPRAAAAAMSLLFQWMPLSRASDQKDHLLSSTEQV